MGYSHFPSETIMAGSALTNTNSMLPHCVNSGSWVAAWTLNRLRELPTTTRFRLPICSIHTSVDRILPAEGLCLPPIYTEALADDPSLRDLMINQILQCFPVWDAPLENSRRVNVVEIESSAATTASPHPHRIIAFSVDTAVEEHGPHLPLGTDTIQSYRVLHTLQHERTDICPVRPLDYGQLTWGLPFGFSIDLTPSLVTRYVTGYANALIRFFQPKAVYVVDVHGSITHREAIVEGLRNSQCSQWAFRWLHEPLAEFASARGDQHAGGVETRLVEHAAEQLIDRDWFPAREEELVADGMTLERAVELTPDLQRFRDAVHTEGANGIVGDIRNYHTLNASDLFERMMSVARADIDGLSFGKANSTDAGVSLW